MCGKFRLPPHQFQGTFTNGVEQLILFDLIQLIRSSDLRRWVELTVFQGADRLRQC